MLDERAALRILATRFVASGFWEVVRRKVVRKMKTKLFFPSLSLKAAVDPYALASVDESEKNSDAGRGNR